MNEKQITEIVIDEVVLFLVPNDDPEERKVTRDIVRESPPPIDGMLLMDEMQIRAHVRRLLAIIAP